MNTTTNQFVTKTYGDEKLGIQLVWCNLRIRTVNVSAFFDNDGLRKAIAFSENLKEVTGPLMHDRTDAFVGFVYRGVGREFQLWEIVPESHRH